MEVMASQKNLKLVQEIKSQDSLQRHSELSEEDAKLCLANHSATQLFSLGT